MARAGLGLGLCLMVLLCGPRPPLAQGLAPPDGLAGRLLVAAPHLSDPNFAQTVIYMLAHDDRGAIGLVINRPLGEAPLGRVLGLLHGDQGSAADSGGSGGNGAGGAPLLVFFGGPVEPYRAFTLHSRDVMPEHSVPIDDDTAYNEQDEVLKALAEDDAPQRLLFVLGYAGWAPGQLEGELQRGDWYVVEAEPSLVFSAEPGGLWQRAVALFSTEL